MPTSEVIQGTEIPCSECALDRAYRSRTREGRDLLETAPVYAAVVRYEDGEAFCAFHLHYAEHNPHTYTRNPNGCSVCEADCVFCAHDHKRSWVSDSAKVSEVIVKVCDLYRDLMTDLLSESGLSEFTYSRKEYAGRGEYKVTTDTANVFAENTIDEAVKELSYKLEDLAPVLEQDVVNAQECLVIAQPLCTTVDNLAA